MIRRGAPGRLLQTAGIMATLWVAATPAVAASPNLFDGCPRSIRLIVPSAAGGAGDMVARALADRLANEVGVPVVVENRSGGSGVIGNDYAAKSLPDGCTLLFATSATHLVAARLLPSLPYDPVRDFEPVVNAGYATSVVMVASALPVSSLAEFVAYARARPGKLNFASSGTGSANHIDSEVFMAAVGIELVHVPYRGTADGYRALIVDEVQFMIGAVTSALPYIRSGKLRALAVLTDRRSPVLAAVPTLAESGYSDADVRKWMGVLAPAGTPRLVVTQLNSALNGVLRDPGMRHWMEDAGMEVAGGSPEAFDRELRTDMEKWSRTVDRVRARPE